MEKKYSMGEAGAVIFGVPVALVAITVPLTLWSAYVFTKQFAWFVSPYFHCKTPSLWLAYGWLLCFSFFRSKSYNKDDKTDYKGLLIGSLLGPLIALSIGYIVFRFALHGVAA